MCGTRTHIVTAAEVTESNVNDSPMLPGLVAATVKNGFGGRAVLLGNPTTTAVPHPSTTRLRLSS